MKVFPIEKLPKEDINIQGAKENKVLLKLEGKEKFDFIAISNPSDSNYIYIIKDIEVKANDYDLVLKIMVGEMKPSNECSINSGRLKVYYQMNKDKDRALEIDRIIVHKNEIKRALENSILFMLPDGGVFFRLEKEVKDIELSIIWQEEPIDK